MSSASFNIDVISSAARNGIFSSGIQKSKPDNARRSQRPGCSAAGPMPPDCVDSQPSFGLRYF
jgi:hypothetical protein